MGVKPLVELLMAVVVPLTVAPWQIGESGGRAFQQRWIFHQNHIGFVPPADPQLVGFLLIPLHAHLRPVNLERKPILVPRRDLTNRKTALRRITQLQQHGAIVVGRNWNFFVIR